MVVVQVVVVNLYIIIYLLICLSICLSFVLYLSIYLPIYLSIFLSFSPSLLPYLILCYLILSIYVSLFLFLFRSGYLSVNLQAGKRSYAARLSQFFNLKTSKTQELSETVSIRDFFDGCRQVVRIPLFLCTFDFEMCNF